MANVSTLSEYINQHHNISQAQEIKALLLAIENCGMHLQEQLANAHFSDTVLGAANNKNVQGEQQQKLDVYADNVFLNAFIESKVVAGVATEEQAHFLDSQHGLNPNAELIICMDPLDGSSNIDVNVPVGSILSIYKRRSPSGPCNEEDFLQPGKEQIGALYLLYGSACLLVCSFGQGTALFALNRETQVFQLYQDQLKAPKKGKIYSINEGNRQSLTPALKAYLDYCQSNENDYGKAYSGRYIGSLVADFHRNLLKGGLYIYPATANNPRGKLRLLYEANTLAFIAHHAHASASDGEQNILDIKPKSLHERCPLYIGSTAMLQQALSAQKA